MLAHVDCFGALARAHMEHGSLDFLGLSDSSCAAHQMSSRRVLVLRRVGKSWGLGLEDALSLTHMVS
jgi:hypothetical protein